MRESAVAFVDEASDCTLLVDGIYGGGNEAYMEGKSELKLGCITSMDVLYGGSRRADVGGDIELTITSGHFGRVFGGNNESGHVRGTITVNIEETGCYPVTIGELYGGGNLAAYSVEDIPANHPSRSKEEDDEDYYLNYPKVNVKSFTSIGRVFGGGLGETAVVTGNPMVNINVVEGEKASYTPEPDAVFAGTTINLGDGTTVDLPAHTAGAIGAIGTVFGGGNAAKVDGNTTVKIGTETTIDYVSKIGDETAPRTNISVKGVKIIDNVYGGGNNADVTGKTNVVIGREN